MKRSALVLLLSTPLLPGCPECEYDSRCDGAAVKTCSLGVDQVAGDPERGRIPCEGENPVCVNLDRRTAQCVREGSPRCDAADFEERCDGDVVVRCIDGYEVAEDCPADGNVCDVSPEAGARCAYPPLESCDPAEYAQACDGTGLLSCESGVVKRRDCARLEPLSTCVVHRSEYGRSVYCGEE